MTKNRINVFVPFPLIGAPIYDRYKPIPRSMERLPRIWRIHGSAGRLPRTSKDSTGHQKFHGHPRIHGHQKINGNSNAIFVNAFLCFLHVLIDVPQFLNAFNDFCIVFNDFLVFSRIFPWETGHNKAFPSGPCCQ